MNSLLLLLSRRRYFAPAWVFASLNIMIGTWVLYIPRVKEKLGIDDGQLGIALFCLGMGTLTALLFSSKVIKVIGVGKATIAGIVLFSLLFLFPIISPSYFLLCLSLYGVGIASCFTDIAMNALVSDIETEDNVHIMSASHGFFSIGGAIAASVGYLIIDYIKIPIIHMTGAAVLVLVTNIILFRSYFAHKNPVVESEGRVDIKLLIPLFGLTVIAFIIMGSEGAIEQWSKLYLEDVVKVSTERIAGMGFLMFSLCMAIGRFLGDEVSKRFGAFKVIIGGCLLALVGYIGVLSETPIFSIVGFGVIGLGFSVVIPELLRLAGKAKGVSSAEGITFVAGAGFVGFLASPPLMGFLADMSSLVLSFSVLGIGCGIAMMIGITLLRKHIK